MRRAILLWACAGLAVLGVQTGCKPPQGNASPSGGNGDMGMPVVAVPAKQTPVRETISPVGTLLANEAVEIRSEIDGTIQEIRFEDGQALNQGDLLVVLDESKLNSALARAEANFKLSQATYERAAQLLEKNFVSQQEFDQSSATFRFNEAELDLRKRELKDARIVAPFSGVLGSRLVSPGQVISKNTPIAHLWSIDPIKVEFNVPERFLRDLRPGQKVSLSVAALPDQKFEGEIYFIAPQIDLDLRTAAIRARLPNPEGKLKPGMFASLDVTLNIKDDAIVVSETALIPQGDNYFVFIVDRESKAQMRPVTPGLRINGTVEIVKGLQAGEPVILEGYQKIGPGMPVSITTNTASSSNSAAPTKE